MKSLIFMFISLAAFFTTDLGTVRKAYKAATTSSENTEAFYKQLETYSGNNQSLKGYQGAALALKAKFEKKLALKKDLFVKGATIIEEAIKKEPNNIELRFIRLSIQENTPRIMGYKGQIKEDKNKILKEFSKQDLELQTVLKDFIQTSESFTSAEKKQIQ